MTDALVPPLDLAGGERDSGLLIRVWAEPDDPYTVRARCLSFEGDAEPATWVTAAGEADVLQAVEQWVRARLRSVPSPGSPR